MKVLPNSLSGSSKDTGSPGLKITASGVVVGLLVGLVGLGRSQANPFDALTEDDG